VKELKQVQVAELQAMSEKLGAKDDELKAAIERHEASVKELKQAQAAELEVMSEKLGAKDDELKALVQKHALDVEQVIVATRNAETEKAKKAVHDAVEKEKEAAAAALADTVSTVQRQAQEEKNHAVEASNAIAQEKLNKAMSDAAFELKRVQEEEEKKTR
jgi:hypothetical protein